MLSGRVTGGALRKIAVACALVTAIGATVASGPSSGSSSSGSTSAPLSSGVGVFTSNATTSCTTPEVRWKYQSTTLPQTIPGAGTGATNISVRANLTSEQLGYDVCPAGTTVKLVSYTKDKCQIVDGALMISDYGVCQLSAEIVVNGVKIAYGRVITVVPETSAPPTPETDGNTATALPSTPQRAEWIQEPRVPVNVGVPLSPPQGTYSNGFVSYVLTGSSAAAGSSCTIADGKLNTRSPSEVCHVIQKVMERGITTTSSIQKDFVPYLVDAPPLTATLVVSGTEKDWFQVWSETQTLINSSSLLVNDTLVHPRQPFTWRTSWPLGKDDLVVTRTSGKCINLTEKDPKASNEWVDIFDPCIFTVTPRSQWLNQPVGTMRLIPRGVAIVTVTAPVSKISVGSSVQLTSTVSVTDERVPFPASSPTWSTTSPACAVNASGVVTGKAEGPCDVYASYQKSENYLADYQGFKKIFVDALLPQTVTWNPDTSPGLTSSTEGGKQFTPSKAATSTGPGTITYSVSNPGTTSCRIGKNGFTVIVGANGTCSVTATAAATTPAEPKDGVYAAASKEVQFTISDFDTKTTTSTGGGGPCQPGYHALPEHDGIIPCIPD